MHQAFSGSQIAAVVGRDLGAGEPVEPMMTQSQSTLSVCPHLGLESDPAVARSEPDTHHRCYALTPPTSPDDGQQQTFCLTASHSTCPFFVMPAAAAPHPPERRAGRSLRVLAWVVLVVVLAVIIAVSALDMRGGDAATAREAAGSPTSSPLLMLAAAVATPGTPSAVAPTPESLDSAASPATPITTPTAEPGGKVIGLTSRTGQAGWWSSNDARGNHLGDSFLYAGHAGDQIFISAMQFDLRGVPRGAPVREASLTLTGLLADRFAPDAGGAWSVQLLAPGALLDPARADFQTLLSAPISVTLVPQLVPADMAVGKANRWVLDAAAREWLSEQVLAGRPAVIARITGPTGGGDSVFAWDSGAGVATAGSAPQLVLSLGPAPATPPPLPTVEAVVATLTPTPANVLTAAANALQATALAAQLGTATPSTMGIVTPTPSPENVATAQAARNLAGQAPIVIYTPTPKNGATATANAVLATAVAVTTGTFTPVPTNAVTPIIVLPTPIPNNPATAMAQMLAATAQAGRHGPNTPLPFGVLVATTTPTPPIIAATPTAGNLMTAQAYAFEATAVAMTTGTFTPTPVDAITPTPPPTETPIPLVVQVTPNPTSTPTATPPSVVPAQLRGKILFFSDRGGGSAPSLYALDPATGSLAWITQLWPYSAAMAGENRSPGGNLRAFVQMTTRSDKDRSTGLQTDVIAAQIFVNDDQYKTTRQLTATDGWSYDPAWSPAADRIAFTSNEPGNDEIYTMKSDGSDMRRLTNNTWEWDKHPSWSPDGTQIVFWSNRETSRKQLWIMNADGSEQRRLLDSPYSDWDPVWVK